MIIAAFNRQVKQSTMSSSSNSDDSVLKDPPSPPTGEEVEGSTPNTIWMMERE
jgi:hypothetical protein